MTRRGVVIGLDGAAWHLLDPLIDKGLMPRLAALRRSGASGTMRSTIPTYTPPAWTSAATGVNPGRHGIYGFVEGHAQDDGLELVHSGKIKSPTIWEMANAQGARVGVYNMPLTYPPLPMDGWTVSGMMTPGYGERLRGFTSWSRGDHQALESKILEWAPGYVVDVSVNYETDWRDASLCERVLASLRQRRHVLEGLLELDPPDLLFSVLESPDRLQHVYYRYMDPRDPMSRTPQATEVLPAVTRCFEEIDRIIGVLHDYAGREGGVIVCSDHGFTAWEVSVHTNSLLERWGYLKMKSGAGAMRNPVVQKLVPVAKRVLPRKVARQAKGRTFAAVDWQETRAFASPIPQQGVYVNLKGREANGIVEPSELNEVKAELKERFQSLIAPDGDLACSEVHLSEEVFHGDAMIGAPDVLPILRDHRYELDDEVFHTTPFTDHSALPRGVHHPDGIGVFCGPGVTVGSEAASSVLDVTPTLLYMAGLDIPDGLDGRVVTDAFDEGHLAQVPVRTGATVGASERRDESPYSPEEEALVEESLRGLGYL
jgi:predicted AlkP superfamily phosphohydrolase/phosphomutase